MAKLHELLTSRRTFRVNLLLLAVGPFLLRGKSTRHTQAALETKLLHSSACTLNAAHIANPHIQPGLILAKQKHG